MARKKTKTSNSLYNVIHDYLVEHKKLSTILGIVTLAVSMIALISVSTGVIFNSKENSLAADDCNTSGAAECTDKQSQVIENGHDDDDKDGIPNLIEAGEDIQNPVDTDVDGTPDYLDEDSDNDSIPDSIEKGETCVSHTNCTILDTDTDNIANYRDIDSDNDNILDIIEVNGQLETEMYALIDTDSDTKPDYLDNDDDNDGKPTSQEDTNSNSNWIDDDSNANGIPAYLDPTEGGDADTDGIPDAVECLTVFTSCPDTDQDGTHDYQDLDSDGDGIPDSIECSNIDIGCPDTDSDDIPDYQDLDSDGDEISDNDERGDNCNSISDCTLKDSDGDGTPNYLEKNNIRLISTGGINEFAVAFAIVGVTTGAYLTYKAKQRRK